MKEIEEIVAEIIKERGDLFLVNVVLSGFSGSQKVLVLIDGDKGIGIEDCTMVSKRLSEVMDEREVINGKYLLEVSSPGVDQPLANKRQYIKNIGRKLKVNTAEKEFSGELKEVNATGIVLMGETKIKNKIEINEVEIPFEKISKAKVLVSF